MTDDTFAQAVAEMKANLDHAQMLLTEKNDEIALLKTVCREWRDALAAAGNAARDEFGDDSRYPDFFKSVLDALSQSVLQRSTLHPGVSPKQPFMTNTWVEEAGKKIDVEVELEYEVAISGTLSVQGQNVYIGVTDYVAFNTTLVEVPMHIDVSALDGIDEYCDFESDFSEETGDLTLEFRLHSITEN